MNLRTLMTTLDQGTPNYEKWAYQPLRRPQTLGSGLMPIPSYQRRNMKNMTSCLGSRKGEIRYKNYWGLEISFASGITKSLPLPPCGKVIPFCTPFLQLILQTPNTGDSGLTEEMMWG